MEEYTRLFQALSDATRIRILRLFSKDIEELCCCEITDALQENQYNISRHLRILKDVGLLQERKDGRWVYSQLPQQCSLLIRSLLDTVMTIPVNPQLLQDRTLLIERLTLRQGHKCVMGPGHQQKA
jgi:ArsR family transcriptional regulator